MSLALVEVGSYGVGEREQGDGGAGSPEVVLKGGEQSVPAPRWQAVGGKGRVRFASLGDGNKVAFLQMTGRSALAKDSLKRVAG